AGEGAAGIFDFFGYGGELFVSGVEPDSEGESYAEDLEERFVRGDDGDEWVVLPVHQAHDRHYGDGQQDENFEQRREAADHLNAADVVVGDYGDYRGGH